MTVEAGVILNNVGHLEQKPISGQPSSGNGKKIVCAFNNLKLRHIERSQKTGVDSLIDETFALLFQTELQIGDIIVKVTSIFDHFFSKKMNFLIVFKSTCN